ncbi:MAG: uroporphyrinogen decarboxylase/cobalamine-independent methonine synthase family protein, partial [Saccharofermentanales bacterium]
MAISNRENYLRTVEFNYPEWIPVTIAVNLFGMIHYKKDMENVIARYPDFFPYNKPGTIDFSLYGDGMHDAIEDDAWGYQWHYNMYGVEGCVVNPPIDDWSKFDTYKAPDSNLWLDRGGKRDWKKEFAEIAEAKKNDILTARGLVHGFLFLRLQYLRGFQNLMIDMAEEEPRLFDLIEMIDRENLKIVKNYCKAGVDIMELPEDLGAQKSTVISPDMFRKYIIP